MKGLPLFLRLGSGVLALAFSSQPSVLRAEDAVTAAKAKAEEKLTPALAKHDANHDGQLDEGEKAKVKADEAARAEKYRQALAKYDANHNGKLDREEFAKMKEDEFLAAKSERQADRGDARFQRKVQRAEGNKATKVRKR